jgi:hypothetical protein
VFTPTSAETSCSSTEERGAGGGGEAGTNYRGPGPDYAADVFVFLGSIIICPLHKLTPTEPVQVLLQQTVSLSDLV